MSTTYKIGDAVDYRGDKEERSLMGRIRKVFGDSTYTIDTYLPMQTKVYKTYEGVKKSDMQLVTDKTMLQYIPK